MRFNTLSALTTGVFVITNYHTKTVLDLSGSDQVTSTLTVSEMRLYIGSRSISVSGWTSHGGTNQQVRRNTRISNLRLNCYVVDFFAVRPLLRHPKRGLHQQICWLQRSGATDAARSERHWCNFTGPVGFKPNRYQPSPIPVSIRYILLNSCTNLRRKVCRSRSCNHQPGSRFEWRKLRRWYSGRALCKP